MRFKFIGTRSFRTQLTLTIALIVFVTIALISILANTFINIEFTKRAEEQQQTHAKDIADTLSHQFDDQAGVWDTAFIHGVGMTVMYDGYIIRLFDLEGNVVWDAENHDMETCNQVMMDIIGRMEDKRPSLSGSFITQEYALQQNSQKVGSLEIRYYGPYFLSESDFHFLDSLNLILALIGVLALLCSVIAGGLLAKRISRPVIKTAQIAAQIADGNYKIRFNGQIKTRELDELVEAVNHMAASLDNQENLRKRLTTDVAHELRTPLTAIASHLEAMIEGIWEITPQRIQSCYEEIGRISGLVTDLEQLAKVENENLRLVKADMDLLELAKTVAVNFESESEKKRLTVLIDGTESHVSADKDRMNQVLANLLSNAIKFTLENGEIHVTVKDTAQSGILIMEDNGVGIPEKDLPFIFERFYRTDKSRNRSTGGAGIGLAIAKSIVTAHGGTITAESEGGKGSRFTVILPK
jgi:signal transduction histidine kinase